MLCSKLGQCLFNELIYLHGVIFFLSILNMAVTTTVFTNSSIVTALSRVSLLVQLIPLPPNLNKKLLNPIQHGLFKTNSRHGMPPHGKHSFECLSQLSFYTVDNMYITSQNPKNQPSSFKSLELAANWLSAIIWSQVISTRHNKGKSEILDNKPAAKI